jgi:hypothetical protein
MTVAETEPKTEPTVAKWVSEGFLTALVSLAAYSLVLKYEQAACEYFGLPTEVVQLSSLAVIGSVLAAVSFLFMLALFFHGIAFAIMNLKAARRLARLHPNFLLKWALVTLTSLPTLWFGGWRFRLFILGLALILGVLDFVIPALTRGERSVIDAINEAEEGTLGAFRWPVELVPKRARWLPLLILAFVSCLSSVGIVAEHVASNTRTFRCVELDSQKWAILRIYGDTAYCGSIDGASHTLTGQYRAVPVCGLVWHEEAMGPLSRVKK